MTKWHSKDVGDGVEALGPASKLEDAFFAFAVAQGGNLSSTIGIFSRYDLRANVVTWYFSPEAAFLAQAFQAAPCEKPVPEPGFGLLVGDKRSWEAHFPGYVPSRHA